ncbi:MAG: helix-turn-helix transcriptional regulator [Candidatus Izemoplasmatales bacterium]|nr:helix-turn-helix transcriptional regulator [Candidatus Izemoplasmatales bacterium]
MGIGLKIKTLRNSIRMTQETLANYLDVSYQAISKWENEITLPDIKLLKPISNFFGVTIDYLLDNENMNEEIYLKNTLEIYNDLSNKGKIFEAIQIMRKGLKEYPKNYSMMSKLAESLILITKSTHEHLMEQNAKEAIKLCDAIINDSNDYRLIDSAISTKFYSYIDLKEFDKAIEIANQRPSMWHSKDFLLQHAYRGSEANKYTQKMILTLMDQLSMNVFSLTSNLQGGEVYSTNEKIDIILTSIKIIETILYDQNYLFYSNRLRRFYTYLGIYYAKLGMVDDMYLVLEKAKGLAIYYDSLKDDAKYTSIIVNSQFNLPEKTFTNSEQPDFDTYINRLERKEFDAYRNESRFIQLSNYL